MKTVAIVGRPNVGKSTFFNRLIGYDDAIVEPTPGVTRDRKYGLAEWSNKAFTVIDTGGVTSNIEDDFQSAINTHVNTAIAEADLIVFIVDARDGIQPEDEEIANLIRKTSKPILILCNKIDTGDKEFLMAEFFELGLNADFLPVSASNGYGSGDVMDRIVNMLDLAPEDEADDDEVTRIAIVGKPNVGKSSLLNVLLGVDRAIVSEVSGTTRDVVDTEYKNFGMKIRLIDTAGLRRRKQIVDDIEYYSSIRTIKAIRNADVCMLLIDAVENITQQDMSIFKEISEANRGVVILVNKWDLVEKDHKSTTEFTNIIKEKLAPYNDVPVFFTSNVTKQRVLKALEAAVKVAENRKKKIPTHKLNEIMLPIIENNPPPTYKSKDVKIKFITQLPTKSPAIAFFCNLPQYVKAPYERFLENKLREHFDFSGIPLRLYFRKK
jgi:GTPase